MKLRRRKCERRSHPHLTRGLESIDSSVRFFLPHSTVNSSPIPSSFKAGRKGLTIPLQPSSTISASVPGDVDKGKNEGMKSSSQSPFQFVRTIRKRGRRLRTSQPLNERFQSLLPLSESSSGCVSTTIKRSRKFH